MRLICMVRFTSCCARWRYSARFSGSVFIREQEVQVRDRIERVMDLMGNGGGQPSGDSELFTRDQCGFRAPRVGHIAKDEHDAGHFAVLAANRSSAVIDYIFLALPGNEDSVIGQADNRLQAPHLFDRILDLLPRFFVDDMEDFVERLAEDFLGCPTCERLCDCIREHNFALFVTGYDRIADRFERGLEPPPPLVDFLGLQLYLTERRVISTRDVAETAAGEESQKDSDDQCQGHQRDKFVAFHQQCVVRSSLPDTRLGLQHFVHGGAHIVHQVLAALVYLGIIQRSWILIEYSLSPPQPELITVSCNGQPLGLRRPCGQLLVKAIEMLVDGANGRLVRNKHCRIAGELEAPQSRLLIDDQLLQFGKLRRNLVAAIDGSHCGGRTQYLPDGEPGQREE